MDKITKNWIDLSDYDYITAKAMLKKHRYLYVAFTCQQSIEKMLKAVFCTKKNETPPYTHNLIKLVNAVEIDNISEEISDFFHYLNAFYIESRYTEEMIQLNKSINSKKAHSIYRQTGDILKWLTKMT